MVKVSIVVPIYNVENYIKECLESIYKQDLDSFEVLCIDDKGKDKSIQKVKEFIVENHIDNLKIIEHSQNKGLSEARNTGINSASGKYICFLDSDDYLKENGIKKLIEVAETEDLDIIEGKVEEKSETKCQIELGSNFEKRITSEIMTGDEYFSKQCRDDEYLPIAVCRIVKTELLKNRCYFTPNIKFEDEEFSPRTIINASKVKYVDIPFYVYRRRDDSITTAMFKDIKWYNSYLAIIKKLTEFSNTIKEKESYEYLNFRIQQIALSILKNPIAYGATKEQTNFIIEEVKKNKIYKIPMKSKRIDIKIQGIFMRFPKIFEKVYGMKGKRK